MKRLIYRVDDRFIHGQVMEGWINYYNINNIVIVNDAIASDSFQRLIYSNVLSPKSNFLAITVDEYKSIDITKMFKKDKVIFIFGSIHDLYLSKDYISTNSYIHLGCISHDVFAVKMSDTVYINTQEVKFLQDLSEKYQINVHKVPWDTHIDVLTLLNKANGQ